MVSSGYPTPDELPGDQTYRCVEVYVPDSLNDEFISVLMGQIAELTREWYWKAEGTYTPEQAAFAWAIALGLTNADGEDCMDCEQIADCIETSTSVQSALNQQAQDWQATAAAGSPNQPISPSIRNSNLIPADALCTEDNKYALALEVVRTLDRAATDLLEILEVITNPAEYLVELSDNAGVFTSVPASAAETAAWIQDSIAEVYAGAYTLSSEEEIACAIFCRFADCDLTFEDIYDAYQIVADVELPDTNSLTEVFDFLVDIILSSDVLIVSAFHLLALAVLRWGSDFATIGNVNVIALALQSAKDEEVSPSSPCVCTEQCYEWDFTLDDRGWAVWSTGGRPFGTYEVGVGWQCTNDNVAGDGLDNRVYIENLNWPASVTIDEVQVFVVSTAGGASRGGSERAVIGTTNQSAQSFPTYEVGTTETLSTDGTDAGDGLRINFVTNTGSNPDPDALTITKVRVIYSGANQPVDGADC